jgi:hypothetical protein
MTPEKSRSKAFRTKAAECARAALTAIDPDIKATYQDLAMQWRELAVGAEDLEDTLKHRHQPVRSRLTDGGRPCLRTILATTRMNSSDVGRSD